MANSAPIRVLIAIPFDPGAVELLRAAADVDLLPDLTPAELEAVVGDYQALIVGSETQVPDRTIEYGYQLQVIGVAGASLDNLNVSAARDLGLEVINVPDPRTLALAEQTFGLMLTLAQQHAAGRLAGKTLGIVGFGSVGHEVARRARAFNMRVLVHQPRLTPELALEVGVEQCELHTLLTTADFVTLHLPTTPETRHLIGPNKISHVRPSAILINTSSTEAVDLAAVRDALGSQRLAAAALTTRRANLDELGAERHPNLMIVPRLGPSRAEAKRDVAVSLARQVVSQLQRRRTGNPLSLRVVPLERVLPHEHFDPDRVTNLAARLETDTTLVNPPVVVEWEKYYVVLDGATRVTAFKRLAYPHIVVQVVAADDERLALHTWYHAVRGPTTAALLSRLQSVSGCRLDTAPRGKLQPILDAGDALCSVITPSGDGYLVRATDNADPLAALNALVAAYTEVGSITRTLNTDPDALRSEVPDVAALVIFPQFTLQHVLQAAVSGALLPAGITRFMIPGRVLRLHADLARLRANESLARKNAWLDQLLAEKLARQRVRYYQEPVILLDE